MILSIICVKEQHLKQRTGYDTELNLTIRLQFGSLDTPSLSLLSGPLKLTFVVPVRFPSMGQIEPFNRLLLLIVIWKHTAVWKLFVFSGNT